jgi:hypothetical protein
VLTFVPSATTFPDHLHLPFSAQVFQSISFSVVLLRPPLVLLLHF